MSCTVGRVFVILLLMIKTLEEMKPVMFIFESATESVKVWKVPVWITSKIIYFPPLLPQQPKGWSGPSASAS